MPRKQNARDRTFENEGEVWWRLDCKGPLYICQLILLTLTHTHIHSHWLWPFICQVQIGLRCFVLALFLSRMFIIPHLHYNCLPSLHSGLSTKVTSSKWPSMTMLVKVAPSKKTHKVAPTHQLLIQYLILSYNQHLALI